MALYSIVICTYLFKSIIMIHCHATMGRAGAGLKLCATSTAKHAQLTTCCCNFHMLMHIVNLPPSCPLSIYTTLLMSPALNSIRANAKRCAS